MKLFPVALIRMRRIPILYLVDLVFNCLITELLVCAGHWARAAWGTPARGEESPTGYLP